MKRIYNMIFFFILSFSFSVSAVNYGRYCFTDFQTNSPLTNIDTRGFICGTQACGTPTGNLWGGNIVNSNEDSSPPNTCVTLQFPATLQSHSYTLVFFNENHKTKLVPFVTFTDSNNPGTTLSNPTDYAYNPIKLSKQADCTSPVSLSVVNNIRENLPISITSGANLDATTSSAIGSSFKNYFPQTMRYYFEVETTLHLKIYKYDSSTSKNIGSPIKTEDVVKRIYYDDTVNVAFTDWMPPAQVDQFTYYNISVESDVTDQPPPPRLRLGTSPK